MNKHFFSFSCLIAFFVATVCWSQSVALQAQQLLLVDGESSDAGLVQVDTAGEGGLLFQTPKGARTITVQELVRWSSPHDLTPTSQCVLTDGSQLVLIESWDDAGIVTMAGHAALCSTKLFGQIYVPRPHMRAILLNRPQEGSPAMLLDRLLAWQGKDDQLHLVSNDIYSGRLLRIGALGQNPFEEKSDTPNLFATFESDAGRLKLPIKQIAGIAFGINPPSQQAAASPSPSQRAGSSPTPALAIGMQDGSWLIAQSAVADADQLQIKLGMGLELSGQSVDDITTLQTLGGQSKTGRLAYLSDLAPVGYRHVPYLDIPWPYRRDRNVLGGRLHVAGRVYPKGLGMHTASRLTYRIDETWQKFAAEIAVDDDARGGGSVVFRVFLMRSGKWQAAYTSPVVCGGDLPRSVMVELAGANQIALAVDYANRGDERDYANWLDARLVRDAASER